MFLSDQEDFIAWYHFFQIVSFEEMEVEIQINDLGLFEGVEIK